MLALHLLNGHLDGFAVLLPGDVLHLQGSHLFGSFGDGRSQHFVGSHTLGRKPGQPLHLFGQFLHQLAAGDLLLAQLLHTGGQVIIFPQRLLVQALGFLHIGGQAVHQRLGGNEILRAVFSSASMPSTVA